MRKEKHEMEYALQLPYCLLGEPRAATILPVRDHDTSDARLLQRIAAGDRDAFETLYGRYARSVLGLALRRLGDRGQAEDAVQETFTSIWRAAKSYRPERGPGAPWLYAVARNAISDRGRARPEPTAERPDEPAAGPGPPEFAERDWVSWRVHSALAELPERERTVVELAYWSELSQSEIADFLNVPLGTVKTRTRSALARLADTLEEECHEP
jgi:RNA polymerase sigma-70 factor, ECF subfamily